MHIPDAHYDAHYLNGPINQYSITKTQLSTTAKLYCVNKIETDVKVQNLES